jgi:hypothetical protein
MAQWLANGFSVQLLGRSLSGGLWFWIGVVICFVSTDRRLAGAIHLGRDEAQPAERKRLHLAIRVVAGIAAISVVLAVVLFYVMSPLYEKFYLAKLDDWTKDGAVVADVRTTVVPTCGKLILTTAGVGELPGLLLWNRGELEFRVDVCVKAAVNRAYPQPEFKRKEIVEGLCSSQTRTLNVISVHFGLCDRS